MAKRILVVEDSPSELKLLKSTLEKQGYEIVTADDGEQAIEAAEAYLPALVILDIVLPKKNGFQVLRHLKTAPATSKMKVILLSSKTQESDRFWGMKQGADEYLTKPVDDEQLLSSVERYF